MVPNLRHYRPKLAKGSNGGSSLQIADIRKLSRPLRSTGTGSGAYFNFSIGLFSPFTSLLMIWYFPMVSNNLVSVLYP